MLLSVTLTAALQEDPVAPTHRLVEEERELVASGRLIDAIRLLRRRTGMALSDARHKVEEVARQLDQVVITTEEGESEKVDSFTQAERLHFEQLVSDLALFAEKMNRKYPHANLYFDGDTLHLMMGPHHVGEPPSACPEHSMASRRLPLCSAREW